MRFVRVPGGLLVDVCQLPYRPQIWSVSDTAFRQPHIRHFY